MILSLKIYRWRLRPRGYNCLKCGAKTATFIFWAALYMVVMKITIFKSSGKPVVKDWSLEPDNNTKWLEPDLEDSGINASNTELYDIDYNATIVELQERTERVRNVCHLRSLTSQPINSAEFLVDHNHNLVWCNIFKAASSSWMYNFNILGGYDKKFLERSRRVPMMLARDKFPRPSLEELVDAVTTPGVMSLLIVREPFVRLLSAFKDKLEYLTKPYYRRLGRNIVAKYRNNATKIFGPIKSQGPIFYEFVAYLIATHKAGKDKTFDEHWKPYYKFCTPCAVNFSVIAKVETLTRDSAYVIQQLGLGHILGQPVKYGTTRHRKVMNISRRKTTTSLKYYYAQLDEQMLRDLLEIYGIDFEMFGYDPKVYSEYVRT